MVHRIERYAAEELYRPTPKLSMKRRQVLEVEAHWHDSYELLYVLCGRATHRVNGVCHELSKGTAALLTPADIHELTADGPEPLSYFNLVVHPWSLEGRSDDLLTLNMEQAGRSVSDVEQMEGDLVRLWEELHCDRPGALPMRRALLDCVLVQFGRALRARGAAWDGGPAPAERSDLERAVLFVDRHFREPLTLARVAAQAQLSPNYLSERFREFTGTPFQVYLQQRRLAFARSLLAATQLGVTDVCHAAGFNSPSHFGRAYRNRYGESPTAFRNARGTPAGATQAGRSGGVLERSPSIAEPAR